MEGLRHLIECHCILPQYRHLKEPEFHKFVVFSVIDDGGTAVIKHAQCNNCEVIHEVFDICKSKIVSGRDSLKSLKTIDDIKLSLADDICSVLENYGCDISTWEHVEFVLDNQKWGTSITLTRDIIGDKIEGKSLLFVREGRIKIEPFTIRNTIEN